MGMITKWARFRLGDVCLKIGSGATPRGGKDVYLENGSYSLIRSQNVHNDGFRREGLAFIGKAHANGLRNVEVLKGDVLLNITGDSVARTCQVVEDVLPARVNQHVAIIRPDQRRIDAKYLRYWMIAPDSQATLMSWAGAGGTRNALTKEMIESFDIYAPTLPAQRAIAHVLGTLDEKIELNHRMNETLEEMARALFKSWFVDFDPVRAKMEGRWCPGESLPGLPSHLYDLFPNRLVDSALGQIPEGWEVKPLGEDFEITMGQSPPGNTYNQIRTGLPFYQGSTDFGFRFPRRRVYCTGPTRLAQRGDSLVSVRAPVGDLNMALEQCCVGRGVASVRHRSDSRSFTYYAMQALRTSFRLFEAEGTVFGALTSKDFQAMLRVSPPDKMVAFFDAWCSPLDRHIEVNERASLLLAAQRDSLLPQLVSGELRLENWEGDNT